MAEPSWLAQAREMRQETPRRSRREISDALDVSIQEVDYWMARDRQKAKPKRAIRRRRKAAISPDLALRMRLFWRGDPRRRCRNPDCQRPFVRTKTHHAVYRQHIQDERGDEWDPDDALNTCDDCHHRHHHDSNFKLPMRSLRPENIAFAARLFKSKARAHSYFHRYYAGEDPRVERLLR